MTEHTRVKVSKEIKKGGSIRYHYKRCQPVHYNLDQMEEMESINISFGKSMDNEDRELLMDMWKDKINKVIE